MRFVKTALFFVLLGLASNAIAQTDQSKTEQQIQGKWQAVKIRFKGEKVLTDEQVKATQLEFLADGVHKTKLEDGKIVFGKYTIDADKSPFWLTFEGNTDAPYPYENITIKSIFRLNGDNLLIVSNTDIRPTNFTSDKINQNILEEYVRVKP